MDPDAPPRFYKACTVPYAMLDKVEAELDRLVAEGTLEPVEYSDWAALIVPVVKSDRKSVRICGNFKVTVGYMNSVDWNGGMERWSGLLDWITGVPRPQMHNLVQLPWLQI